MPDQPLNLFAELPTSAPEEQCLTLLQRPGLRIERIVSTGQASPPGFWYDQPEHEWLVVLAGRGVVEFADGRCAVLERGDQLDIPAHCRHRVAETAAAGPTLWLAVFYPGAE